LFLVVVLYMIFTMRILIIEDDIDTADYISERLKEKCFAIDLAHDGTSGLQLAKTSDYDLILLDYTLPKKDGLSVSQEIRNQIHPSRKNTPIIMISVTGEIEHKVKALGGGIDDYVTKPFFFDELHARMQAVLRRPGTISNDVFELDDLTLDTNSQKVTRGKTSIYLTKKEFALLEYLMRNKGSVVSRGAITEHVWDMNIDPISNTIEMHILNLRKKLELPRRKKLIHSVPGRGYKIDTEK
jgi:DNA-binding response OmpR family regulator